MKFKEATKIVVWGIIFISLIGVMLNLPTDNLINFLLPLGISFMLSSFIGEILENWTGDFFKKFYLSFPIWKFRINLPLFIILVWVIKFLLFK